MSQVYAKEPPTTGRVILQTSHGPIDVNLWCKECPTTTRLFLQLCVDGYYDGMIFHRILNDFLIQCGSERSDKKVSCSENQIQDYLNVQNHGFISTMNKKKLELSPRIRFNHRGQVALALPLDDSNITSDGVIPKDMASLARQFFITLDEAPFLNDKHIVFGTVTGPTVFNAIRVGKTETKDTESGVPDDLDSAPSIKSIKIDFHLFDDLVETKGGDVPWKNKGGDQTSSNDGRKRRKKRKGKRNLNVLSFGGEIEEGDDEALGNTSRIRSSHDFLITKGDKKIANDQGRGDIKKETRKMKENKDKYNFDKGNTTEKLKENSNQLTTNRTLVTNESIKPSSKSSYDSSLISNVSNQSTKRKEVEKPKSVKEISVIELRRAKYVVKKNLLAKGSRKRDDITMSKLSAFKEKMLQFKRKENGIETEISEHPRKDNSLASRMIRQNTRAENMNTEMSTGTSAPTYAGQVLESDEEKELNNDWLRSRFKCKKHIDHIAKDNVMGGDGRNMDDYEIIDEKPQSRRRHHHRKRHRDYDRDRKHHKYSRPDNTKD